nr:polyadenylate-binding protein-interacting protein 12-like isoform X1 [Tanacetum cinerariifolium]
MGLVAKKMPKVSVFWWDGLGYKVETSILLKYEFVGDDGMQCTYCGEDILHIMHSVFICAESAIAALNCSGAVLGSLPIRVSPSKTPVRPRAPRPVGH